MSKKIKRFIDCVLPVSTCNLKCHYCCITINNQNCAKLPDFTNQAKLIGEALSIKRFGGPCVVNICGEGETLLPPGITLFIENLLKAGHYVMVVTNGTVKRRFEEIVKLDPELLHRLFFKFSFHYLELIRTKQLDVFFDNINKIKNAGCSFSLEMTPNDEIIPQIDSIKELCIKQVGALCHLTVTRDGSKPDLLPLLTKLSPQEYENIWSQFDSKMFKYKLTAFGKKNHHFCYAGDWTLFLNLGSGELKQCYRGKTLCENIYSNPDSPIIFEAIGYGCREPHCYNAHAFLTFGTVPSLDAPTYLEMRDRVCKDGTTWVKDELKDCFSQKLKDNNDQYSIYKKMEVGIRNMSESKFMQNIFSINKTDSHKIIRLLGIKIKIKYDPNKYSEKYKKELQMAYHLLKDRDSKKIFKARVKYLNTYDIKRNKIPSSKYEEYHHPKVPVQNGDILIDAGVSEWLDPTILFSKKVGENGLVIGFEPEPNGFEEAKKQINKLGLKNIKLEKLGLWDKDDTQQITQFGRGSSFFWKMENTETVDCVLTSLDKYLEENKIQKIDFIKMDIEGAEVKALKGSERTIICNKPNLAICVYHKPEHLFEIIFYLNSLNLGYDFYLGHHRDNEFSTVLYAVCPKR